MCKSGIRSLGLNKLYMKKDNNNKTTAGKPQDKETAASISNGKKAIEVQKKTSGEGKPGKASKDDAEKWRNEG